MKMNCRTDSTIQFLIIITICSFVLTNVAGIGLKFAGWGEKCKIPKNGEHIKFSEDCENSKGIFCQQYGEGQFCGCQIRGALSYDKQSDECRRKSGSQCSYPSDNLEIIQSLPFNHKCHTRADCIPINYTAESTGKTEMQHICVCKPGFKEDTEGFGSCIHTSSASAIKINFNHFSLITLLITALFLGRQIQIRAS